MLTEADKRLATCVGAVMVGVFSNDAWVGDMAILTNSGIKVTSHDYDVMVGDALNRILQLFVEDCFLLYTYRDLHSQKDRHKNSLFALEKPADWSYDFFHK